MLFLSVAVQNIKSMTSDEIIELFLLAAIIYNMLNSPRERRLHDNEVAWESIIKFLILCLYISMFVYPVQ